MPSNRAARSRRYYEAHKEEILQKKKARSLSDNTTRRQRRARMTEQAGAIKEAAGCMDCDRENLPAYALDFDHVRGEKIANVARLIADDRAWAVVHDEIAKCEVVCATCHRLRTHRRLDTLDA